MSDTSALSLSRYHVTAEHHVYDIHDYRYGQPYLRMAVTDTRPGTCYQRHVTLNGELTPEKIAAALRFLALNLESPLP